MESLSAFSPNFIIPLILSPCSLVPLNFKSVLPSSYFILPNPLVLLSQFGSSQLIVDTYSTIPFQSYPQEIERQCCLFTSPTTFLLLKTSHSTIPHPILNCSSPTTVTLAHNVNIYLRWVFWLESPSGLDNSALQFLHRQPFHS